MKNVGLWSVAVFTYFKSTFINDLFINQYFFCNDNFHEERIKSPVVIIWMASLLRSNVVGEGVVNVPKHWYTRTPNWFKVSGRFP